MSNNRISLLSGGFFDFVDMDQSVYTREDVAHNLSRLCRFTGATAKHYSVAQHAVLVSYAVPPEFAFEGLTHDDEEFVTNDLNTPLKSMIPEFKRIAKEAQKEMLGRVGIIYPLDPCVKLADMQVFLAENRDLRGLPDGGGWYEGVKAYPKKIVPWSAAKAKREYLKRFYELEKARTK